MRKTHAPSVYKHSSSGAGAAGKKNGSKGGKQGPKKGAPSDDSSNESESGSENSQVSRQSARQQDRRKRLLAAIPEESESFGEDLSPIAKRSKVPKILESPTQIGTDDGEEEDGEEEEAEEGDGDGVLHSQFSMLFEGDDGMDNFGEGEHGEDEESSQLNQSLDQSVNASFSSAAFSSAALIVRGRDDGEESGDDETIDWMNPAKFKWEPSECGVSLPLEVEGIYKTLIVDPQRLKSTRKKSMENTFVSLIFVMVSCYCCDHVATQLDRSKSVVLWGNVEDNFQHALVNMPKKAYMQDAFFSQLKGNGNTTRTWPAVFTDFVAELYKPYTTTDADGNPTSKPSVGLNWANKESSLKGLDADNVQKMKWFVGHKVFKHYTEAKGRITAYLAKRWIPQHEIPSGYHIEHVFRGLRKTLRPMEAFKRASASTKVGRHKENKGKSAEDAVDLATEEGEGGVEGEKAGGNGPKKKGGNKKGSKKNQDVEDEAEEDPVDEVEIIAVKARQVLASLGDEWYPEYWLAFVLFSTPAAEHCLQTLNGGEAGVAALDPLVTATQAAKKNPVLSPNAKLSIAGNKAYASRNTRDNERAKLALELSSVSATTSKDVVEHVVTFGANRFEVLREKLAFMEGYMKNLQAAADEESLRKYAVVLKKYNETADEYMLL